MELTRDPRRRDDRLDGRLAARQNASACAATRSAPVFGHIPNLVTMRGDRYRDALTAIASIERVRELRPEMLITGHFDPIRGAERIDAELTRLRDAIAVHPRPDRRRHERRHGRPHPDAGDRAARRNSTSARATARCPGTCGRSGRTTRAGSTTAPPPSCTPSVPTRSAPTSSTSPVPTGRHNGPRNTSRRDGRCTPSTSPKQSSHTEPTHAGARDVLRAAHENLLDASTNFWESAWLTKKIGGVHMTARATSTSPEPRR